MDHSEENNKDVVRTSQSEETKCSPVQSFSESFRIASATVIDLEQLRACCLAPNGLVLPEWRKSGWPKLVGAHVEIWRAAAKIPPMDFAVDQVTVEDAYYFRLHHPSKDEIAYIKQVVASCKWESTGILKEDPIVMPEHQPTRRRSSQASSPAAENNSEEFSKVERRVSFHLPELAFSTRRQKDRKTLRKVLIHLKRTNPNLAITNATCSAVAMVLAHLQSSSLSTLVIQQLVAYPWKYSREWSNNDDPWELDDQWQTLIKQLAHDLVQHFERKHVEVLEGTIRYSWIPSWLSQNIQDKNLLARIWDVLIPSKPDAILFVCISLLSHFQKELMAETDTNKIRSLVIDLPSKLDSMEEVEAVVSRATKWMKESVADTTDLYIPAWVTATVAPADSSMVEYARHLRETVKEEGTALISSDSGSARNEKQKDWFSVDDPKSRFALALKAKTMKENETEARTSSNKSSWILVLLILLLAAATIVGLETDCSVLLGTKRTTTTQSNCLRQILDLCWENSQLQAMGYRLQDEISQVLLGLKILDAPADTSTELENVASSNHIQEEEEVVESSDASDDVVVSPSENLGDDTAVEALKEETDNEAPQQLYDSEDAAHAHEDLDEFESSVGPEEDTVVDQGEPEAPEPILEEPDSSTADLDMYDDNDNDESESESESSDDPVDQSRRDAERLLQETLDQTEKASKLAESIVSQFLEEAKSIAGGKVVEDGAVSETTQDSSEERQPEQSSDDHTIAAEEEFIDLDHHFDIAVDDSKDETDNLTPELDESSSKKGLEAPDGDDDQTSSNRIEDQVDEEGIEGSDEDLEGAATEKEAAQDQSDSIHSLVQIEERQLGAHIDDDDHTRDVDEGQGTDEVSGDHSDDPSDDEAPMSEQPRMDGYTTAEETMDDSAGDEADEKSMETDPQAMEATGAENHDGATVLEMAQGLLSRYLGYVSSDDEPREIIQLSTPFFGKDDVSDVFEQLMMVSRDDNLAPMQKWDQQSKARFSTWESTVLI